MKKIQFYPDVVAIINDNGTIEQLKEPCIDISKIPGIITEKFLGVLFPDGKPAEEEFLEVLSEDEFVNPTGKSQPVEKTLLPLVNNIFYTNPKEFLAFVSHNQEAFIEQSLFLNKILNDKTVLQSVLTSYSKNTGIKRKEKIFESIFDPLRSKFTYVTSKELALEGMLFDPNERKIYSSCNNNSGVEYVPLAKDLVLPDYVDGIPVEVIGGFLREKITSVVISQKAKIIDAYAFSFCDELETVQLPENLESIKLFAFQGCNSLKSINLPSSLRGLGASAFYDSGLESIQLPEFLESVGSQAFSSCKNLRKVVIPEKFTMFSTQMFNGTAWVNEQLENNKLLIINNIVVAADDTESSFAVPEGVIGIGPFAFYKSKIEHISLPESLEFIGEFAFSNCVNLTSVVIPKNVKIINNNAFHLSSMLETVSLPNGLEKIGNEAFYKCSQYLNLVVPDSVTKIGNDAFVWAHHVEYHGPVHNKGTSIWGAQSFN